MRIAGIDGCRAGWICASATIGNGQVEEIEVTIAATIDDALAAAEIVAIDVPIGLPDAAERGGRAADRAARALLGPRRASVFSAPVRGVLACATYDEALAVMRASSPEAIGLSKQAWNIVPKIREVDALVRGSRELRTRVFEAHPEVSFAQMAGAGVGSRKTTDAGRRERLALLEGAGLGGVQAHLETLARRDAKPDDLLDAGACLWTARRISAGDVVVLPQEPPADGAGLPMAIRA